MLQHTNEYMWQYLCSFLLHMCGSVVSVSDSWPGGCEKTRKHMGITDHHDMTLAVKGALNRNTTNQPNPNPTNNVVFCLQLLREGTISQRNRSSRLNNLCAFIIN